MPTIQLGSKIGDPTFRCMRWRVLRAQAPVVTRLPIQGSLLSNRWSFSSNCSKSCNMGSPLINANYGRADTDCPMATLNEKAGKCNSFLLPKSKTKSVTAYLPPEPWVQTGTSKTTLPITTYFSCDGVVLFFTDLRKNDMKASAMLLESQGNTNCMVRWCRMIL